VVEKAFLLVRGPVWNAWHLGASPQVHAAEHYGASKVIREVGAFAIDAVHCDILSWQERLTTQLLAPD